MEENTIIIGTAQRKNGRRMGLGGDQSILKLFTYVHGVPGGENMGGNIPTYFLVQSKGIISRQTSIREERSSNWVNNLYSPNHNYLGNRFIRVAQRKESYSQLSSTTSTLTNYFLLKHYLIHYDEVLKLVPSLRKQSQQ